MVKDEIIISECSKFAQKEYKTKHDWMDKYIHWELGKKLKFDHVRKWFLLNPESFLENETYKLSWDCEIQTDHLISFRQLEFITINKKERTCRIVDFTVSLGKIERK